MPLDHTRFVRRRPGDPKGVEAVRVSEVVRGNIKADVGPSQGLSASGDLVDLKLHDVAGKGQLTHDMNVGALLQQILYELKWQRMYFQEMSGGRVRISPEELANDDR